MSAVMGAVSGSKDIPFNNPDMEKEKEKGGCEKNEPSELHHNDSDAEQDNDEEFEKLARKLSYTSVCSTETDFEADEDDKNLDLGPQFSLKEQLEKDKDDESLTRWKEQLLGSVDINAVGETAEPEVQITSLTILSPDRPDVVLPIPFTPNSKGFAFALKDGSRYRLKFSFIVSNNIVSGLKYTNTVWKTGVRVENTRLMLGTFSPQQEPYAYELAEETTPSGLFARGSYSARTRFVDDDGKCYLDTNYCFEIRKDWPTES
ncbi:rho GDP-dissociation inhibitor 1-like [Magnolia sinica]|uniref:rho GDP-dissociation inhibitor 1-like n=1 Tax=Magnolia sinica TaxID=86752 RepID=UPI002658385C|nr:rho GDP-dissociation inhibitor 1-like [Magnolia sinica]